jgi:hypothetical protein
MSLSHPVALNSSCGVAFSRRSDGTHSICTQDKGCARTLSLDHLLPGARRWDPFRLPNAKPARHETQTVPRSVPLALTTAVR